MFIFVLFCFHTRSSATFSIWFYLNLYFLKFWFSISVIATTGTTKVSILELHSKFPVLKPNNLNCFLCKILENEIVLQTCGVCER